MKLCSRCALPEVFPGISFGTDDVCNYCSYFTATEKRRNLRRESLNAEFHKLIKEAKSKESEFDCIVCFSGGNEYRGSVLES